MSDYNSNSLSHDNMNLIDLLHINASAAKVYRCVTLLAGCLFFALISVSCKEKNVRQRPVVTVSVPPQAWMLNQIAGNDIEINTLLKSGADPETFEPSMKDMRMLEESREYAMVGTLPFEQMQGKKLKAIYPSLTVATAFDSEDECSHDEHGEHDHRHDFDPHVWTTPSNLAVMADSLLATAIRSVPSKAKVYRQNHRVLIQKIRLLQQEMEKSLSKLRGKYVLIWHPTLTHMSEEFGFRQLSIQEGHKEPTPQRIAMAMDVLRNSHAVAFVIEAEHSPRMAEAINSDLKFPMIHTSLMQPDIINSLKNLCHDLAKAAN